MNLVEYQTKLESMIETHNFDQRSQLENLAVLSPEHRKIWEDFLIMEHTLPAWKQAVPEVDLVEAVLTQLNDSEQTTHELVQALDSSSAPINNPRLNTRLLYVSMISVTILLFAVSLKFWGDQSKVVPPNTITKSTNIGSIPKANSPKQATPNNRLNQLLYNARAASWGLAQSTAGAMTEAVNLVPIAPQKPESTDANPDRSNWVDDINNEMQPLKEQISHAWNFIIHSVPEETTNI
ncbi:hypothetical protein [Gimesia aquarii]|uniref:Uncharacterized protein n=1 Tax=Gimesia aquarii TaxID=2527964 RepID=A0A517W1F2_9PLAN|nr:hypothetical protein [Gimesia aquarii]QDT99080.1 hypothetical protein V144x_45900 [Gimesia aquarii]